MKTITDAKSAFLVNNGYANGNSIIRKDVYKYLSDEQKENCYEMENGDYGCISQNADISSEELENAVKLEVDRKLFNIENHIINIKYCIYALTAIIAVTTLISLISAIVSYSVTKSAMRNLKSSLSGETDDYDDDDDDYDFDF